MEMTETAAEGLKRAYTVKVPASELDEKINAKLETVRADFQMKGFRKGKAPMPMLKKMFGKSVMGETVQELVDGAVRDHFQAEDVRPAAQPDVKITNEDFKEGDDLEFEFSYERLPEIPDVDFKKMKLEKPVAEVDDAAVDEALDNLAKSAGEFEKSRGMAKDGFQVVIDFIGKVDGEEFEGGKAEDYPLVLGSNSFIPGFEDQLIGAKAGEEKQVEVVFPENYGAQNLAGKAATFDVTVKEVRKPAPAAVDDELARKYSIDSLDALKDQLRERLAGEYAGASRQVMKRRLLDALESELTFDLPSVLVDQEANQIAHQLWHEENPQVQGHDHPEIEPTDEHFKLARRRVGLGLLLADVGQRANVEVTQEELGRAVMQQASQYPGKEKEFFDYARQNQAVLQQIRAPLFEEKVVDYITELAEVTEKTVSKDELQKEVDKLDEA